MCGGGLITSVCSQSFWSDPSLHMQKQLNCQSYVKFENVILEMSCFHSGPCVHKASTGKVDTLLFFLHVTCVKNMPGAK